MAFSDRAMQAIGDETDAPKDYERYLKDENVQGFLSGINKHEGYPAENETVGYQQFKDLSDHPNISVKFNSGSATSTAAGKYQIIKSTWEDQKKKQNLKDFSEEKRSLPISLSRAPASSPATTPAPCGSSAGRCVAAGQAINRCRPSLSGLPSRPARGHCWMSLTSSGWSLLSIRYRPGSFSAKAPDADFGGRLPGVSEIGCH